MNVQKQGIGKLTLSHNGMAAALVYSVEHMSASRRATFLKPYSLKNDPKVNVDLEGQ
jgi:hypothetical protein